MYIEEERLESVRQAVLKGAASVHPDHPAGIVWYNAGGTPGVLVFGDELAHRTMAEVAGMLAVVQTALADAPR